MPQKRAQCLRFAKSPALQRFVSLADAGQRAPRQSSPPGPQRGDVRGAEVSQEALGWLELLQGVVGVGCVWRNPGFARSAGTVSSVPCCAF